MRLIDADAIKYNYYMMPETTDSHKIAVSKDKIDAMPTIEAEPVRHGRWVTDDEFIDCSICRREKWSRVPYEDLVKRFRYCPNCGVKMDEEKPDATFN